MSSVKQEHGGKSILAQPQIRLLLRRARLAKAGKNAPEKKDAITLDILNQLVASCGNRIHDVRDKALLYVGFAFGGHRRSELTKLRVEDITLVDKHIVIRIRKSKTDQAGDGFEVPLFGKLQRP